MKASVKIVSENPDSIKNAIAYFAKASDEIKKECPDIEINVEAEIA